MAIDESAAARVTTEVQSTMSPTAVTAPSPKDVIKNAKDLGAKMVDFRFTDLPGTWQHFSVPVSELTESVFSDGIGFDGSSIRGFQKIHESDMLLFPDPARSFLDPVLEVPTLVVVCDIADPLTRKPYSRDPRYVARKAEEYLRQSGIAETSYWGPEAEFYIFNSIRYDQNTHEGYYFIDSDEGVWNTGKNGTANLGYRPKLKGGYFPVPPVDKQQDLRSRIVLALIESGIDNKGAPPQGGAAQRGGPPRRGQRRLSRCTGWEGGRRGVGIKITWRRGSPPGGAPPGFHSPIR